MPVTVKMHVMETYNVGSYVSTQKQFVSARKTRRVVNFAVKTDEFLSVMCVPPTEKSTETVVSECCKNEATV